MSNDHQNKESQLIDYIEGNLSESDRSKIEKELIADVELYKQYEKLRKLFQAFKQVQKLEPSVGMQAEFERKLSEEIALEKKPRTVFTSIWYKIAAAIVLLVLGGGAGYWISVYQQQKSELVALKKEMELTRQVVFSQLNNSLSASQRMLGVKAAYQSVKYNNPDDEIVNALIKTMNEDDNGNVRLAALEALSSFVNEDKVRTALIESLAKQTDPVVQIALIQLLVEMKETDAIRSLQQIIDDEESIPAVKDEAHAGIFKLS